VLNNANLPRRYPGLKPFERTQRGVFYGREEDILKLSNLIQREKLVLLFAKSGIGKTSLLQAGVGPEMEKKEYAPIFFRADKTHVGILESICETLEKNPLVTGKDSTGQLPGAQQSLWELLKRLEFDINGLPATPVLVFDQFEEVFTLAHSEESRNRFLNELADLANETVPESMRQALLERYQKGEIDVETMQWWEDQPELRIVLSIRSDFLHLLDQVSHIIPGILRNRYQLHPLSRDKARVAITRPAQAEGEYASHRFQYSEAALQQMVDFLAGEDGRDAGDRDAAEISAPKRKDEVETVNLQIVCQDVEERIIDYQCAENHEVKPDFYGELDGLKRSIRSFYNNQLQLFPKAYNDRLQQKKQLGGAISMLDNQLSMQDAPALIALAQRLIEENLVTSGNRRNSVVDDTLLDAYSVTPDFLDTLVDKSRLLRKEPRLDDFYYEISHDTLLPAIIESRDSRRLREKADEDKARLEAQLKDEEARRTAMEQELKAAKQHRRQARMISIISLAMLALMVAFAAWVLYDYIKSVKEELRNAEINVKNEFFGAALPIYDKLQQNKRRRWVLRQLARRDIDTEIKKVRTLGNCYKSISDSLRFGDELFFINKDFVGALRAFHHTKDTLIQYDSLNWLLSPLADTGRVWRVDKQRIEQSYTTVGQRIESARRVMINQFKVAQRDFETFNEARVWNQALRNLQRMQRLLPDHTDDIEALQEELNLGESPREYVEREYRRCVAELKKRGIAPK
jgi:hypothetical protein